MKVYFIQEGDLWGLQYEVNNWLNDHSECEIIDIKYATVPCGMSRSDYSAMIIYK